MNNTSQIRVLWVCQAPDTFKTRGMFYGDNPLGYATPAILAQLSVSSLLSSLIQLVLTPLGESAFISMLLAGFGLGPTLWGESNQLLRTFYPVKSLQVTTTFAFFGCILFMFLVGIKMDISMVKRTGKKAVAIGFLTFLFPVILNLVVARILIGRMEMRQDLLKSVYYIAIFQSVSAFHVIVCLLADLKLLNSELGQLATSSSMISSTLSFILVVYIFTTRQGSIGSKDALIWSLLSVLFVVVLIWIILRPVMVWMIENTAPERKQIKEGYIISIFLMLLGCALISEVVGQHLLFGATALGIVVPHGPPLGSAIVDRLESFVSCILLPSYFVLSVSGVNILSIHTETITVVGILGVTSFVGKILGGMLPALYCNMPLVDAFSLGLIMSSKGIADVLIIQHAQLLFLLDNQIYSIMVIDMLLLSGIFTPVIKVLYNPSKRYETRGTYQKRTIQHMSPDVEFRILACIYHQDSTPSVIGLLEVSNPTPKSPICCYAVHLVQLTGSLSPSLLYHKPGEKLDFRKNCSSHIINAFRVYEKHSYGNVIVNLFTSISPFATIHEEVCRLALRKRTTMLIVPFHKQWRLHGIEDFAMVRPVNRQILARAPCSVGILFDRGTLGEGGSRCHTIYNIGIIFVHGNDDREALAYGLRMAQHPNVSVTLIHITDPAGNMNKNSLDMELDNDIIYEFKVATSGKKHHFYRQEIAKDSVELITVVRSVENSFDLILAGKYHDGQSPLFVGLSAWKEFPELGFIGDMLTSSDSQCEVSVLVVQQQICGVADGNIGVVKYERKQHPTEAVQIDI